MVYPNYDRSYVQPMCDLCGSVLSNLKRHVPVWYEVAVNTGSIPPDEGDLHICNDCYEIDEIHPTNIDQIRFHFAAESRSSDARLLLVEIDYQGNSVHKYTPGEAREWIEAVGMGIVTNAASHEIKLLSHKAKEIQKTNERVLKEELSSDL